MRDIVVFCFLVSIMISLAGAFATPGDFAGQIYGFMFWCIGLVIAWGRTRHGS